MAVRQWVQWGKRNYFWHVTVDGEPFDLIGNEKPIFYAYSSILNYLKATLEV